MENFLEIVTSAFTNQSIHFGYVAAFLLLGILSWNVSYLSRKRPSNSKALMSGFGVTLLLSLVGFVLANHFGHPTGGESDLSFPIVFALPTIALVRKISGVISERNAWNTRVKEYAMKNASPITQQDDLYDEFERGELVLSKVISNDVNHHVVGYDASGTRHDFFANCIQGQANSFSLEIARLLPKLRELVDADKFVVVEIVAEISKVNSNGTKSYHRPKRLKISNKDQVS